jgi:hypothetical protein
MKTHSTLRIPKPRKGLKLHLRSHGFVVTRPTIARDGRLVRRVTFALRIGALMWRRVPAALPLKRRA